MSEKTKDQILQEKDKEILQLKKKLDKIDAAQKRSWNIKVWIARRFAGVRLNRSINKLTKELPNNVTKETLGDVTASIIWRITRIGIFTILVAAIPSILLFQQNRLFKGQNKLFKQQTTLIESQRRSNYVLLMSNILDKVDEELRGAEDIPYHQSRDLSELTIGRVTSLSHSLKPYFFLEGEVLIDRPLSPERGQLLLALTSCKFNREETYSRVYAKSTFNGADLFGVNLDTVFLVGAKLEGANLREASLKDADLRYSFLSFTDLTWSKLRGANLTGADLRYASLSGADLRYASLIDVDLSGADLTSIDLGGADLSGADLRESNLYIANMEFANLTGADLSYASLTRSNLIGVEIRGANLTSADLNGVIVGVGNWINSLKDSNVKGAEEIKSKYFLEKMGTMEGETFYSIREKSKD